MATRSLRNAIGPPHGRATIEVGIAVGAMFMPKEPDLVVMPAVILSIIIVSATVIPSIAVSMFIVVLLPLSMLSMCLLVAAVSAVAVSRRRCLLLSSRLLTCPLVAVVSVVAVPLTAAVLLSRQQSFACCDAQSEDTVIVQK